MMPSDLVVAFEAGRAGFHVHRLDDRVASEPPFDVQHGAVHGVDVTFAGRRLTTCVRIVSAMPVSGVAAHASIAGGTVAVIPRPRGAAPAPTLPSVAVVITIASFRTVLVPYMFRAFPPPYQTIEHLFDCRVWRIAAEPLWNRYGTARPDTDVAGD